MSRYLRATRVSSRCRRIGGRVRKRIAEYVKDSRRPESSGTVLERIYLDSWLRLDAARRWPATSWPIRFYCRSSAACVRPYGQAGERLPALRAFATNALRSHGPVEDALLRYLSPLGWEHINLTGDYLWRSSAKIGAGKFRPLRPLPSA